MILLSKTGVKLYNFKINYKNCSTITKLSYSKFNLIGTNLQHVTTWQKFVKVYSHKLIALFENFQKSFKPLKSYTQLQTTEKNDQTKKKDSFDQDIDKAFKEADEKFKKLFKEINDFFDIQPPNKSTNKQTNDDKSSTNDKENSNKKDENDNSKQFNFLTESAYILAAMYILNLMHTLYVARMEKDDLSWSAFRKRILNSNEISSIHILNNNKIAIHTKTKNIYHMGILSKEDFLQNLKEACHECGINSDDIKFIYDSPADVNMLTSEAKSFGAMLLLLYLYFTYKRFSSKIIQRRMNGSPFSDMFPFSSKKFDVFNPVKSKVTFNDVKGCDEAKKEIMEFVEFLKAPEAFQKMGATIPKGAILYGPPGTGKTLMAKAVAGEAGVPFIFASGSEFIEMLVGVGAKRVRQLFESAKKNSPCIIFIDEIDAIGASRSKLKSHSENDQTLNQLLCELDGFNTDTNVILLCGTNQFNQLDSALIRAGRLDRKVYMAPPDMNGRIDLFDLYLSKIKIDQQARFIYSQRLAGLTPGTTGADIASICNESAILATKQQDEVVQLIHLEQAIDRLVLGNRLSRQLNEKEKNIVSIHECGHAVVSWFLKNTNPLLKVSIVPRGQALGVNQFLPTEDHIHSQEFLIDTMAAILGGRAAEELIIGSISTGASDDLQKVTALAYQKVGLFGMDETIGMIAFPSLNQNFSGQGSTGNKEYGPEMANKIDISVQLTVKKAYDLAKDVISNKKELLLKLSEHLYEKEILSNIELEAILGPRPEGALTVVSVVEHNTPATKNIKKQVIV